MNARLFVVGLASLVVTCLGLGCRQILDIDEDRALVGGGGATTGSIATDATSGTATGATSTTSTSTTTTTSGSTSTTGAPASSSTGTGVSSEWPAWPLTPDGAPTANYALDADTATDLTTGLTWPRELSSLSGAHADAVAYCDALDLGQHTDWRLPTRMELHTLLSYAGDAATINEDVFHGDLTWSYWTSSPYVRLGEVGARWAVSFSAFVGTSFHPETEMLHFTCVRRDAVAAAPFEEAGGIITAPDTSLSWQKVPSPAALTWTAAGSYCADLDLGGSGWRVPTALELLSIIDTAGPGPELLDPRFTSGQKPEYWSSTRDQGFPNHVTVDVRFGAPRSRPDGSPSTAIVRCVR